MIEKILKVFNITYDNLFEDVLIAFMGNTEDTMEAKIVRELRLMSKEDILLASDILTYLIEHKNE